MDENLGFGSIEACQAVLGIKCSDCKYHDDCIGEDVDNSSLDRSD